MRFIALVLASTALVSGCSTIVNGKSQSITIDSNVKGAEVLINQVVVGQTPFVGQAPRGSAPQITVRKEGFESRTVVADTGFEPIFWGNIIIGGFLGSTTDAASGSMYKYSPASLNIELRPVGN